MNIGSLSQILPALGLSSLEAVRPVPPVGTAKPEAVLLPDTYESSAERPPLPSVTYNRSGKT
jgi:hypothetical protein